jgi:hypothetical protein
MGFPPNMILVQSCNMPNKVSPPPPSGLALDKELGYLRAQLRAVETLIRALEDYQQFSPKLVTGKTRTA